MSKSILEDALQDAKVLQETAVKNARNVLVEAISPQIKEFVDSYVNNNSNLSEMPEELASLPPEELQKLLAMLKQYAGKSEPESDTSEGDMTLYHQDDDKEGEDMESAEEGMYEADDHDDEDEDEMKMDETVSIDEADLKRAWNELVRESSFQLEGQAPSPHTEEGFGDADNPNSNAKGGLGEDDAPGERGLEDKEKEEMWKDHEPPASSDWTVKENAYKKEISRLQGKVNSLQKENKNLTTDANKLKRSLHETILFNSKLFFTNKLLQKTNLTNEQKIVVIESLDSATSMREAELVYKSLSESFKIAGVLSESRKRSKKSKSSRFVSSASANMLREGAADRDRRERGEDEVLAERMQTLAGINYLVD